MIAHTTPNGSVIFLSADGGKLHFFIADPVNRMGVLEWLLLNGASKDFVKKITTFLNAEYEAAAKTRPPPKAGKSRKGKSPLVIAKIE